jgi:hypothetical protein
LDKFLGCELREVQNAAYVWIIFLLFSTYTPIHVKITHSLIVLLQERLTTAISDFQEVLELIDKYDWDFDTYLEEDVPAAVSSINPL